MRRRTLVLLALLCCAACGGAKHEGVMHPGTTAMRTGGVPISGRPAAPTTSLHDDTGAAVRLSDFRGKWVVVAFLYTHCPDVCPLIAQNLNTALRQSPDLRVVAISVDPKGDTPKAVRAFVKSHRLTRAFRYLIGTRAQLAPVWRRWHVVTAPGPSKTVSHSSFEVLVDPQGRERRFYDAQIRSLDVVHDLRALGASVHA